MKRIIHLMGQFRGRLGTARKANRMGVAMVTVDDELSLKERPGWN